MQFLYRSSVSVLFSSWQHLNERFIGGAFGWRERERRFFGGALDGYQFPLLNLLTFIIASINRQILVVME